MNIHALEGHKVFCDNLDVGCQLDLITAKHYLTIGNQYTVECTEVNNDCTYVWLKEIPNRAFNSIYFKDVIIQSKEMDKQHPDYLHYNTIFK